jgi:hypothetical protein
MVERKDPHPKYYIPTTNLTFLPQIILSKATILFLPKATILFLPLPHILNPISNLKPK